MRTDEQARATGWAWRWTGWASWPVSAAVLWVCAAAVILDVTTSWLGEPEWYLGRISLSPALRSAALLVALIGPGNLGCLARASAPGASSCCWAARSCSCGASRTRGRWPSRRDVEGIVVAVAGEELVYRLAAVLLIGAASARGSPAATGATPPRGGTGPALGGLVGAGLVFAARCPGTWTR